MSISIADNPYLGNNLVVNSVTKPVQLGTELSYPKIKLIEDLPINFNNLPYSVLRQQISNERIKSLNPIVDIEEYDKLTDEIFKYKTIKTGYKFEIVSDVGYQNVSNELRGLIPYCGIGDISNQINSWLSGRDFDGRDDLSDDRMRTFVRVLEYSLKELDKKYDIYSGKLYRTGYFNPNSSKQYYSASDSLYCASAHSDFNPPLPNNFYSIIKAKTGHKIYDFQLEADSKFAKRFAETEKEVLIDRKARFRKLSFDEYSNEDISDILSILNMTMKLNIFSKKDLEKINSRIVTLKYISVWEEI